MNPLIILLIDVSVAIRFTLCSIIKEKMIKMPKHKVALNLYNVNRVYVDYVLLSCC